MTVVDGRTRRGERNREAIIDALIACYDDGILRPSVQEVADRAGVSARSVHNHFVDVEALRAEVASGSGSGVRRSCRARPTRRFPIASRSWSNSVPPCTRRSRRCGGRRCFRSTNRPRSWRTSPAWTAVAPADRPCVRPRARDPRCHLAAGVVGCLEPLAAAQGCMLRTRRTHPNHSHPYRRSRVMSAIKPNKQQFVELMEAPDEGPVVCSTC